MLSPKQITRAWKDTEYRDSLSQEEQAQLPENPVGLIEVTTEELSDVSGGTRHPAEAVLQGINHPAFGGAFNCDLTSASGVTCNSTGCGCIVLPRGAIAVSLPLQIFQNGR